MSSMPSLPDTDNEEINLVDLWRTLMRYKWLIILITLLSIASAVAHAMTATHIYQADVLLEPVAEDSKKGGGALAQLGGLAAMAGVNLGGGGSSKDAAIAKLQSRIFIQEFLQDENLLPILFEEQWNPETKNWKESDPKKIPTLFQGVDFFKKILKITDDKKTSLVTLTLEWQDKEQTARWANLLVERINRHLRTVAIQEAKQNMEYLNLELTKTTIVELRQAISSILEDQIKRIMLANVRTEFAFKILDPAVVPERRIRPKRALIVIMGAIAGLFLGIVAAFSHNAFKQIKPAK
ncbi:MAG: hypothetical protein HQL94_07550 [Magnetococcales bacterium]|nr:hypothetical protein [Magnetococcales bacterium]